MSLLDAQFTLPEVLNKLVFLTVVFPTTNCIVFVGFEGLLLDLAHGVVIFTKADEVLRRDRRYRRNRRLADLWFRPGFDRFGCDLLGFSNVAIWSWRGSDLTEAFAKRKHLRLARKNGYDG